MNWHYLSVKEALELTDSSPTGLSSGTASLKLQQNGPNTLQEKKQKSWLVIFIGQFKEFMSLVLIAAAIISGIIGDLTDAIIIVVIVLLNAVIGFVQEYRAEKAILALKKMAALQAVVQRDGQPQKIPASELVTGDIVLLEAGNVVPADLRLIENHSLRIDESALTGESVAVDKTSDELSAENIPLGDRINMAYKGTLITNGRGRALVVATGMNTEIGKIARLLQDEEAATPLQIRMADYGRKLSLVVLGICAVLFGMGLLRGEEWMDMLLLSISLAVAAIPEALPALITIALAMGAKRLAKQNALIRKLPAVETLGSVSYICSDKTGTLTLNKMKVVETYETDNRIAELAISPLMLVMALNHDVRTTPENTLTGDPTEIALVEFVKEKEGDKNYNDILRRFPRVAEIPFDSDRKCMTSVHGFEGKYLVLSKGAVEYISEHLRTGEKNTAIPAESEKFASKGLRVLAFAGKILDKLPEPFTVETVEKDLIFAGLAGMIDPARPEVKAAIAECRTAGIKPVMITGDHPATATAIAREIGILDEKGLVMTGTELRDMSADEFAEKVEQVCVYARVSPEQKINIVKALQAKGHFVSMTGDGVNDAPSLRAANIGVAMGISGTDVSKEAAHMILLDDNFATIVKTVKEGRRIYDNIRKFVKYIMTCNSAEIWTIFLAPLLGLPIPLLPIHILWINLVTDGLPGLALAREGAEADVMQRPPVKSGESLLARGIGLHILWVGLLMAGVTLGVQAWAINHQQAHWQTMVFTVLSLSQLGHVIAIRSEKTFLYKQGIFSNPSLLLTIVLTALLQMVIVYLPAANEIFKTQPLSLNELLICLGLSAVVFHAVELEKWVKGRVYSPRAI
ncbi:MAG: cation-translocating P-type ATPase [Bacteroidia bacterium]|nr:cation-translocating P-type ATPase [Bacteroidia bacterium]